MLDEEIDIPLEDDEKQEKLEIIKKEFIEKGLTEKNIHKYMGYLKHGLEIETIKDILPQFEKIIGAFKRPVGKKGLYKYSFIYSIEKLKSLYLCFFLDQTPPKFFNAYYDWTNQERKIKKKIEKWLRRETNK